MFVCSLSLSLTLAQQLSCESFSPEFWLLFVVLSINCNAAGFVGQNKKQNANEKREEKKKKQAHQT